MQPYLAKTKPIQRQFAYLKLSDSHLRYSYILLYTFHSEFGIITLTVVPTRAEKKEDMSQISDLELSIHHQGQQSYAVDFRYTDSDPSNQSDVRLGANQQVMVTFDLQTHRHPGQFAGRK